MNEIMEKLNKLSLPVTILIASIILGGFYYATEANKQNSIERQQQIRLEQEKQNQITNDIKEAEAKFAAQQALNFCLDAAENKFKESARYWLNFEAQIGASNVVEEVDKEKIIRSQDRSECFRKFPQG